MSFEMNAYLIEDDPLKASALRSFFAVNFPSIQIRTLGSFQSGMRAIEEQKPDLVLLDMTLPTFDRSPNAREGRLRPLGGYDVMRKMRRRGLTAPVMVVTQLEAFGEGDKQVSLAEMTRRCESEFPGMFLGSVYYHPTSSDWTRTLSIKMREWIGEGG
jgi:DNA-binding response OmpR family regulator